jgi:hypothetical protein
MRPARFRFFSRAALAAVAVLSSVAALAGGNYEFLAAPQVNLNLVFRVNRVNGEVGACHFGLQKGAAIGVTLCYPPGEGAKAGAESDYSLVASHHTGESGVFRVDLRTGEMAVCYLLAAKSVVCTPPAK